MLQEMPVILVSRQQILLQEPGAIRRHIVHGVELVAHERGAHQSHAFLRQFRAYGMNAAKCGREPLQRGQTPLRVPNSLPLIRARWRRRRHDLPRKRCAMLGIGRNQSMQESGSATWQANDKKRFANFLTRDLWMK